MQKLALQQAWQAKQRDPQRTVLADSTSSEGWMAAPVPGTIYEALIAAERIPDPFDGLNELAVQWVAEVDWLYRCDFELTAEQANQPAALHVAGLDTIATVWLNDQEILNSDNMFVPQRVVVSNQIQVGTNMLLIEFRSALKHGHALQAEMGQLGVWNGDPSRLYLRKAQYHYGWDWGPALLTAGPWMPITLELGATRLSDLACPINVADDCNTAVFAVTATVADALADTAVLIQLRNPAGELIAEQQQLVVDTTVQHSITVEQPSLWWPHGYGQQDRYRLVVSIFAGQTVLDQQELQLGVRRVRLVQEPLLDEAGETFLFEINNVPMFSGGANWIPADLLTNRVSNEHYRRLLQAAVDSHMLMIRIWGGGIYEVDYFYDLCDELGLLVWQDFMFACGMYPAHPAFLASVEAEAIAQVQRLRHHPSIVLWCGNNEDYQIAQTFNAYDHSFQGDFTKTSFPAREIYERLLPKVCANYDPTTIYWPGSPYGGADVYDKTRGDRHTWDVWHSAMAPYQDYPKYEGRFVSEFGMESCAALSTLLSVIPEHERYPQSRTVEHHNKSEGGARRLAVYLNDTLRFENTLESYVYATQFMQAEALAAAYRGWRRRWGGTGRYAVAGALVWQLNDCWPVISWAIIDSALRKKPAIYSIGRELAPISAGLQRNGARIEAWVVNGTVVAKVAIVQLIGYDLYGKLLFEQNIECELAANQANPIPNLNLELSEQTVVGMQVLVDGMVVARASTWPEPFKYLPAYDPQISVTRLADDWLEISSQRPAKGVWLQTEAEIDWSDNLLDLLPNQPQRIHACGLGQQPIDIKWLHWDQQRA
ncbi:glycoside hydrolase family 2 protein [Herpetosiphon gulosus]|uniref:Beta-mannosidase B n=1 Tax=Herpetosiphon gulosus TaxID=1973496 RepID=A0ABP9WXN0_9CHLR